MDSAGCAAEAHELAGQLRECLARLDERLRRVWECYGEDVDEAARVLGVSPRTVKRLRQQLCDELARSLKGWNE